MLVKKAADALKHCGNQIAGIIGEAASRGEFELVVRLGSLAAQISSLAEGLIPTQVAATSVRPSSKATVDFVKPKTVASQYPKFARFDDQLVKIGWSKKEKAEYVHKAPRTVIAAVCSKVEQSGLGGKRFSGEDVTALSQSPAAIPTYQIYLCFAWLRAVGLVKQHGRNQYSIVGGRRVSQEADVNWNELPAFESA